MRMKLLLSGEYDDYDAILTSECRSRRHGVLRLVQHAVPYVLPLGREKGL